MELLKRKIDHDLTEWKNKKDHLPLIVKGARQIGKTLSIRQFAQQNYKNVIEINFALQKQYKSIFDNGFEVDTILKNISLLNPSFTFTEGDTLFFFDELQDCANCATSLKPFHLDGRYDVICSGSLMGINYQQIESNSVGFKEDYEEDITKYAGGLYKGKILNVFRKIPAFLGRDNKKFQISKVADGARGREYVGTVDWLDNAGMINRCY